MNRINKEQILFLLTLVVLGVMVYFRYNDQVSRSRVPKSGTYAWTPINECPDVRFLGEEDEYYSSAGRNVFMPPQDWTPLAPLRLESPPLLELLPVWPYPEPSLSEEFYEVYALPLPGVSHAGEETAEGEEVPAEESEPNETDGAASAVRVDLAEIEEKDPLEALKTQYDWIKLSGQRQPIFGQVLNQDKFSLLKSGSTDSIRLKRLIVRSGKWAEIFDYERDRIEEFGFAATVTNLFQQEKMKIIPNATNIAKMQELARWCIDKLDEDPEAVAYAVEMARMAIDQDPLLGRSHLLLADIYETAFDLENELLALRKALECTIREPGIHVRYGRILERYGLDDAAEDAYKEGLRIRPGDAESLMTLGDLQIEHGECKDALYNYEEALRSPTLTSDMKAEALIRRGRGLLALNRIPDALQEAGRAIHFDDEEPEAWNLKGSVAFAGRDLEGAQEAFRKALEIAPDNARFLANLGVLLLRRGETESAIQLFAESAALDPFHACRVLASTGFVWEMLGEIEKARASYSAAVEVEPDNVYALYLLGRFQRRMGESDEAEKTLKRVLRIRGRMGSVLGELGYACLCEGKYEDADFYFKELLKKREKKDYRILFLQGIACLRLGKSGEAERYFSEAAASAGGGQNPELLNGLAVAAYNQNRVDDSMSHLARVIRLFPEESQDPDYLFAQRSRSAIETHRLKSQWIDRFKRKEIKNEWEKVQRYGPLVFMSRNRVHFRGVQKQGMEGDMTQLRRVLPGKEFRAFEAELMTGEEHQGIMGIFIGTYMRTSASQNLPQAEIRLGIDHEGRLLYRIVDQNKLVEDWQEVEGRVFEKDVPVKLGFEVVDYEKGIIRLLADDGPVLNDRIVKKLRKIQRPVTLGIFGVASGGRKVDFTTGYVRMVKTR